MPYAYSRRRRYYAPRGFMPASRYNRRFRRFASRYSSRMLKSRFSTRPLSLSQVNYQRTPMPLTLTTKLTYMEFFSLNPGAAGAADTYVFQLNGLYDPNITGTGHQPAGFDELMLLYEHYEVLGSKIQVTYDTASSGGVLCGVKLSGLNSTSIDPRYYMENGDCNWTIIHGASGGQRTGIVSVAVNPAKYVNSNNGEDNLKGTSVSNPTEGVYALCFAAASDGVSDHGALSGVASINFTVRFSQPKQVQLS